LSGIRRAPRPENCIAIEDVKPKQMIAA